MARSARPAFNGPMQSHAPVAGSIGLFDSGVGGLGVLLAVRDLLPHEPLLYLADSANFPYGPRATEDVIRLSVAAAGRLIDLGARLIVVACNTASTAALPELRRRFAVPFVGMVPAVKPAAALSRAGRVAVLATEGTVEAGAVAALVEQFAQGVTVRFLPAPGLAARVEAGDLDGPVTRVLLSRYLEPAIAAGADVVVLGCTHYVFLRPAVEAIVGPAVTVLDTGRAVARQVVRVLHGGPPPVDEHASRGAVHYYTSGDPLALAATIDRLRAAAVPLPPGSVDALPISPRVAPDPATHRPAALRF